MLEPRTPIPWTPRTILHLAVAEDVDFAVLAANNHAKLLAYVEHDCFGCNERGRCEEAEELRRIAIEEARK